MKDKKKGRDRRSKKKGGDSLDKIDGRPFGHVLVNVDIG